MHINYNRLLVSPSFCPHITEQNVHNRIVLNLMHIVFQEFGQIISDFMKIE